ncbi:MAG TPA: hypothetical protein VJ698_07610 [Noviherbaspirillum sp.]|uniref:hypothetical protein n=1 Tax=Noviherbaspirillum sp. TaxID=1926288 RepID=UPI002B47104C|nr:hypothetical protein [Noviherbaspirillum sp.]HJV85329.1 hypothetical protein [Noviherbaspirillum sp.]
MHDADGASMQHQDKHFSASTCSACAACCIGTAMLPSSLDWTPVHTASIASPLPQSPPYPIHFPERLKRPPRHLVA